MIIGIDLGTTNSLVAYFTEEGSKIIPNRLGDYLTPSIVSIDESGQVYVGKTAKERAIVYPQYTASVFKRSIGTEKEFELGDKKFSAMELSSFVLRSLKEDAETFLGETVLEAVISVPAYFNDLQRKATKQAGELAGLKVERIISEPTAAAISYGLDKQEAHTKFLVFDLGGGTFDVSILELYKNIMEVRAVAGDNYLGGEDFTNILYYLFLQRNNLEEAQLPLKTVSHIKKQAEISKINFSKENHSIIKCKIGEKYLETTITLEDYEQACQFLLAKIKRPIERSLKDAKVKLSDIQDVILVGGATRLPVIRKFVGKLFGRFPNCSVNPDEAVALGAAIQAGMKERNSAIKEVILTDVCPFTLGTEVVVEREDSRMESGHFFPIIERNTVIPVSRTERLYTAHDNQTKVCVKILQGESRFAKNNLLLGELDLKVPKGKAGEEAIDITYTYDINAILEVEATIISTKEKKKILIQKEGTTMTKEEAEERIKEISYLKINPREEEENKLILFRGERLYEEAIGEIRNKIDCYLQRFEIILDKQDRAEIELARKELKEIFDEIELDKWNGEE